MKNDTVDMGRIAALDHSQMFQKIQSFPDHLAEGWSLADSARMPDASRYQNIVFSGMGGSAIAGDIISALTCSTITVPMIINRNYTIPDWVDGNTLFFASSYSGNTEETVSALADAGKKGASIICMSAGGTVGRIAEDKGYPLIFLPPGFPPRAALGYSLGALLRLFSGTGLLSLDERRFNEGVNAIRSKGKEWQHPEAAENTTIQIARAIHGRIPVIYVSADRLMPVGLRWKTQINENAKQHAFLCPYPEMNHNEIMGWETNAHTKSMNQSMVVLVLTDKEDHSQIQKRMIITNRIIKDQNVTVREIPAVGDDMVEKIAGLIHMGDWISFYLGILNDVDPTEIRSILYLKEALSSV